MTDANAQGTAAHTQPTSDSSDRTAPNRPAATTRHYDAPDADCVRGSEYSEILALETEQRKRAAEHRRKRGHAHPATANVPVMERVTERVTARTAVMERVTTSTKTADWRIFAATSPNP